MKRLKTGLYLNLTLLLVAVNVGCLGSDGGGGPNIVSAPLFSMEGGTYTGIINVKITSSTADAAIYYTVNGDAPTTSSAHYIGTAVAITGFGTSTTLKALAVKNGMEDSVITEATYTLQAPMLTYQYGSTMTTRPSSGNDIALDSAGNMFITGSFEGSDVDFDPGTGIDLHSSAGECDMFLSKFNADGSYAWTKTIGSTSYDYGHRVVADSSGNVIVTGHFRDVEVDFDPGVGEELHTPNGQYDVFVTKFTPDGNHVWTNTMGGTGTDEAAGIAIEPSGDIVVTGYFLGTDIDFDSGPGESLHSSNVAHTSDVFVSRYTPTGAHVWTVVLGGTTNDMSKDITTDSKGNILVTGLFSSKNVDFDPGPGEDIHSAAGSSTYDIFVTKLGNDGSYLWTHSMGGINTDWGNSIAVDSADNILVTGEFTGTNVDFDPGAGEDLHSSKASGSNIYVTKYSSNGSYLWTKTMGGTAGDRAYCIVVDAFDNFFIGGSFFGTDIDFDPGIGEDFHSSASGPDMFISRFNSDGTYDWTKTISHDNEPNCRSMIMDSLNNLLVAGNFNGDSTDFNPYAGTDYYSPVGSYPNTYILKLTASSD